MPAKKLAEMTPDLLLKIEDLASRGLTMEQIAYSLGVAPSTFYERKASHSEFSEAIKRGQAKGVEQITNVVFSKALEGDLTACFFFLKCRANWNDRPKPEPPDSQQKDYDIEWYEREVATMSDEELNAKIQEKIAES